MRPSYSRRITSLLSSPNAKLIVLQFPNDKSLALPGPPWGVSSDMYLALLSCPGEEIKTDAEGKVVNMEELEQAEKSGLRRVLEQVPRRTHPAGTGENGEVNDVISVWGW